MKSITNKFQSVYFLSFKSFKRERERERFLFLDSKSLVNRHESWHAAHYRSGPTISHIVFDPRPIKSKVRAIYAFEIWPKSSGKVGHVNSSLI